MSDISDLERMTYDLRCQVEGASRGSTTAYWDHGVITPHRGKAISAVVSEVDAVTTVVVEQTNLQVSWRYDNPDMVRIKTNDKFPQFAVPKVAAELEMFGDPVARLLGSVMTSNDVSYPSSDVVTMRVPNPQALRAYSMQVCTNPTRQRTQFPELYALTTELGEPRVLEVSNEYATDHDIVPTTIVGIMSPHTLTQVRENKELGQFSATARAFVSSPVPELVEPYPLHQRGMKHEFRKELAAPPKPPDMITLDPYEQTSRIAELAANVTRLALDRSDLFR